jgi:hypothetical protein
MLQIKRSWRSRYNVQNVAFFSLVWRSWRRWSFLAIILSHLYLFYYFFFRPLREKHSSFRSFAYSPQINYFSTFSRGMIRIQSFFTSAALIQCTQIFCCCLHPFFSCSASKNSERLIHCFYFVVRGISSFVYQYIEIKFDINFLRTFFIVSTL